MHILTHTILGLILTFVCFSALFLLSRRYRKARVFSIAAAGFATAILIICIIFFSLKTVRKALFQPKPFLELLCSDQNGKEMHVEVRFSACAYDTSSYHMNPCNSFICSEFTVAEDGIHYDMQEATRTCTSLFQGNGLKQILRLATREGQHMLLLHAAATIGKDFQSEWDICTTKVAIESVPEPTSIMPSEATGSPHEIDEIPNIVQPM